jgi:hypothetical protein
MTSANKGILSYIIADGLLASPPALAKSVLPSTTWNELSPSFLMPNLTLLITLVLLRKSLLLLEFLLMLLLLGSFIPRYCVLLFRLVSLCHQVNFLIWLRFYWLLKVSTQWWTSPSIVCFNSEDASKMLRACSDFPDWELLISFYRHAGQF